MVQQNGGACPQRHEKAKRFRRRAANAARKSPACSAYPKRQRAPFSIWTSTGTVAGIPVDCGVQRFRFSGGYLAWTPVELFSATARRQRLT